MEIRALELVITEHDLTEVLARRTPDEAPVRDLRVRVTPEGVVVKGSFRALVLGVPFETLWRVDVEGGRVSATLAEVKVAGFAGDLVRREVLNNLRRAAKGRDGVEVEAERVLVDVDRLLAREGVVLRSNLTAVRCGDGHLVVEASRAAS